MHKASVRTPYVIADGHLYREVELESPTPEKTPYIERDLVLPRDTLRSLGLFLPVDGRIYLTSHE